MTRLIDADALTKELEKVYEYYMAEIKDANEHPDNYTSKFLPATAGAIDGLVEAEIVIADAPTIEPDADTISRIQAIKDVSEWATDILHPDRLVKEDAIHILESLQSAEQVTGKLNNPDDSLLTADSEACKEQKSKLDLISRQDAILAITGEPPEAHYPSWYADRIKSLPSAQPNGDLISREDAITSIKEEYFPSVDDYGEGYNEALNKAIWILEKWLPSAETSTASEKHQLSEETPTNTSTDLISRKSVLAEFRDGRDVYDIMESVEELPSAEPKTGEWIPVSERLPEYRQLVLVSSFWGVTVAIRDAIKEDGTDDFWDLLLRDSNAGTRYIYAWMPLPKPYREDGE